MGRKGTWFSAVKKVLSPDYKKDQKKQKSKNKWFGCLAYEEAPFAVSPSLPPEEDIKLTEEENEQNKHAYSVALANAVAAEAIVAAEAAVAAAQAAAEVVRLTSVPYYHGKSKEELAAIKIQTAFRGYLARRALRGLRGLVRLKTLIQGQYVKRQAASTLQCLQTVARLQSQIRERRARMSEENQVLQGQLQQKHEKELEKLQAAQTGEEWDDSTQSKEQIKAKLLHRHEAARRRERALAYAFSHQLARKNFSKSENPTFMDPNNPHWGWSWGERWMISRPWESQSTMDHNDRASVKSVASQAMSGGGVTKLYSIGDHNHNNKSSPAGQKSSRPPTHLSPSTPATKAPSLPSTSGKVRSRSPKGGSWGGDDDSRSMLSTQSERYRRYTISGSSMRDDESLTSSAAFPSKMIPTRSAKAKSRLQSPSSAGKDKKGTPEKGYVVSAKKRLSFPASPAGSRKHSGPPKVDSVSNKDDVTVTDEKVSNGGSYDNDESTRLAEDH